MEYTGAAKFRHEHESEYLFNMDTLSDGKWHDVVITTNRNVRGGKTYYGILYIDGNETIRFFDGGSFSFLESQRRIRSAWFLSAEKGSTDFSVAGFSFSKVRD
jgi:hypothetical protein